MDLKRDRIIAIDTETYWDTNILQNKAFIASTTDQRLHSEVYDIRASEIKPDYYWSDNNLRKFLGTIDLMRLKATCEDPTIHKVFFNAPYDIGCLYHWGIKVCEPIEDVMVMAAILDENYISKKLKDLAKRHLKEKCEEEEKLKQIKKQICAERGIYAYDFSYDMIPTEVLYPYAKKDTEYTIKLAYLFNNQLEPFRKLYDMEMELIPIIVEMTLNGIRLDREFLAERIIKFGTERNEELEKAKEEVAKLGLKFYKKQGKKLTPVDFNPRSVKHIREVWEHLGLPVLETTKKGEISTNAKVLKEFLENEENYEQYNITAIKHIARYRFLDKQLGTYAIPLYLSYTDEGEGKDRGHFNLWQSGAKTGRFSAELIQTMPRIDHDKGKEDVRMIRFAFIPEEDNILAFIDYEQIEMRLFAHFSKSALLIKDLNNGFDPHMGTVYNVFPKEIIDSNPIIRDTFRSMIKAINFGIMYGMGKRALVFKIKDMIYRAQHVNPEVREEFDKILRDIDGVLRTYYSKYPVDVYTRGLISELYKKGHVEISIDKGYMDGFYRIYRTPHHFAYKAVNMIIQGSAAYVMKYGMIRAYKWIKKHAPWIKLLLTVHDELVFEIPKDKPYVEAMLKLKELMEDHTSFDIPIDASIKATHKNWGEAYGLAIEGICKKHGKLPEPDEDHITYCAECKKKYMVTYKPDMTRLEEEKCGMILVSQ